MRTEERTSHRPPEQYRMAFLLQINLAQRPSPNLYLTRMVLGSFHGTSTSAPLCLVRILGADHRATGRANQLIDDSPSGGMNQAKAISCDQGAVFLGALAKGDGRCRLSMEEASQRCVVPPMTTQTSPFELFQRLSLLAPILLEVHHSLRECNTQTNNAFMRQHSLFVI